jgi:hypothetical protein
MSAEGAEYTALSGLTCIWLMSPRGVAPGYYISRRWRDEDFTTRDQKRLDRRAFCFVTLGARGGCEIAE